VESSAKYLDLEKKLDSMGFISVIKQLGHTGGTSDQNVKRNWPIAHMNLMNLYKDKFQDIQNFPDQYVAIRKDMMSWICNLVDVSMIRWLCSSKMAITLKWQSTR